MNKKGGRSEQVRIAAFIENFPSVADKTLSAIKIPDLAAWRDAGLKGLAIMRTGRKKPQAMPPLRPTIPLNSVNQQKSSGLFEYAALQKGGRVNTAARYGVTQAISLFGVVSKGATVVEDVKQVDGEVKVNWRRLYATLEIGITTGLFSMFISAFFAFLISGIFRIWLKLGDDEAMLKVFVPVVLVLFIVLVKRLPRSLRKMGIIGDPPDRFGPWFKWPARAQ
ncbi:hypothetical protein KTD26_33440 [Burkholderia multivorans]|uniref:hypothetical protein n=1 Tax=Burkholderia multivorans TaxID=87883 RepID=UPI001C2207B6|nr:hypothetical protein [Burkholderia multivorans]MBU9147386.1 hypothetical protein [Burkholderia multivorans]